MPTNNSINLASQGVPYYNGTGTFTAPTLTNHGMIVGDASNAIKSLSVLTNGQMYIGSTGLDAVAGSISPGAGISISGGPGTLTIAAIGGGISWQTTSTNIANIPVNSGYACISPGGALTLGLPTTAGVGSIVEVTLAGATSWQVTQAAGQSIRIGSNVTTTGAGGSLTSTAQGDSIKLLCVVANLTFQVLSLVGNITYV